MDYIDRQSEPLTAALVEVKAASEGITVEDYLRRLILQDLETPIEEHARERRRDLERQSSN